MRVDWKLSETLIAKCKKIENLRKQGKTWYEIEVILGNTRNYLIAIYMEYKRMKGGMAS